MKALKWIDDNLELVIMGIALTVIVVVVLVDVFGRSFLGRGITWGQEISRTCEIIIAAMGISYGVLSSKHIKVEILPTFIPVLKGPLEKFGDLASVVFYLFIAYFGIEKLGKTLISGVTTAVLEIPMFYIYLIMELGLVMAALRTFEKYIKMIISKRKEA